jgi:hydroxymethylpyrimidine/phosphomethylpyrimidine kinase
MFLKSQLEAVFEELRPNAIKSGMLFSVDLVDVIADFMDGVDMERIPWVLDPVLIATSGARLLESAAESVMVKRLFPKCALLTPNLDEALEL